jgi:hypothetical protein
MATALARINYSRRMVSRVETGDDVWVYWSCCGIDDVSRVCDLSVGGLFQHHPVRAASFLLCDPATPPPVLRAYRDGGLDYLENGQAAIGP